MMPRRFSPFCSSLALPLIAAAALSACNTSSAPPTVRVSGIVTYKGAPLTKGAVHFQPAQVLGGEEGAIQRPAVGIIGPDGRYTLSAFPGADGVLPGDYRVAVVSYAVEPTLEESAEGAEPKLAIPEKYADAATSGLRTQIAADSGDVEYNIELTD